MYRYYDIHTHRLPTGLDDCLTIQNIFAGFEKVSEAGPCSIGLHPWHLDHYADDWIKVQEYAGLNNVLAIGECGLDSLCNTPWPLQEQVFREQISLAHSTGKPLIIHCVRAFGELLQILQMYPQKVRVIIHGYNKKQDLASRLLAQGYYLSFGAAILNKRTPAVAVLAEIPATQFFLETDEAPVAIEDIYARAAQIRKVSVEDILLQVQENFNRVFSHP